MHKYRICVFLLLIIGIFSFNYVYAKNISLPLFGKLIYIDPGHGGLDPGALYKDIYEKDINLEISKKLEESLSRQGAIVFMTRYGDYDLSVKNTINRKRSDLSRRSNIINKSNCDLYISVHLNAETSSTWRGGQIFYDDINSENKEIAEIMQELFAKKLSSRRKYKKVSDLYLQKRVKVPGVLIEVGFISNPNDRYLLKQKSYQTKVADVITEGVIKYFSN
jgi:N-acetylmuramoyl-L-alanine amidase